MLHQCQSSPQKLPIAIINEDHQAVNNHTGTIVNAGQDVIDEIMVHRNHGSVSVVDFSSAISGLKSGKYSLGIDIPADFSHNLVAEADDSPISPTIRVIYNNSESFFHNPLSQHTVADVLQIIQDKYRNEAAHKVIMQLSGASEAVLTAYQKTVTVKTQANHIENSTRQLDDNAKNIADIAVLIRDAYDSIANTVNTLTDAGIGVLSGLDLLAVFGANLDPDFSQLQPIATQLEQNLKNDIDPVFLLDISKFGLKIALEKIVNGLSQVQDPHVQTYVHQLRLVKNNIEEMNFSESSKQYFRTKFHKALHETLDLYDPHGFAQTSLRRIRTEGEDLHQRIVTVRTQLNHMQNDSQDIKMTLLSSTGKALSLSNTIKNVHQLAQELHTEANSINSLLQQHIGQSSDIASEQKTTLTDMLTNPIGIDKTPLYLIHNSKTSIMPFLLTLGLFTGAILVWIINRPYYMRALTSGVSNIRVIMASIIGCAPILAVQAGIITIGLWMFAHFSPKYIMSTLLFIILATLVFAVFIQMLIIVFGSTGGKIIASALLGIQILISGGIFFPYQDIFIRIIHFIVPTAYAIDGLRILTYIGVTDARLWTSSIMLIVIGAVSLMISTWSVGRKNMWKESDLFCNNHLV